MGKKNERLQLLNELALAWEAPLDAAATAAEVVRQVVSRLGFDFATVSLVDAEHHRVYCAAECNAGWRSEATHDLDEDDVQCLVVKEGEAIANNGKYEPYLDRSIWEKYNHRATTRIWVPIRQRKGKGPEVVLGTIEAGFHHHHRQKIPSYLQSLLEQYAALVAPVLLSARQQTRNQDLLGSLEALHEVGAAMQEKAAVCKPLQMAALIGQSAERVLHAEIVMVFLPHHNRRRPKLVYMTGGTPEDTSPDGRGFWPYLSEALEERLRAERAPYFSLHAPSDPTLVKLGPDGRPLPDGRSFTQRHNVRSFAGVPLIAPSGGILGYVCLDYLVHREFSPEMRHVVLLFAEHAAAALQKANNHHLAVNVAIAHERNIMAAEVHNRLSAGLACDQTLAQTAMTYLREGDPRLCGKLEELLASIADNKAALHQIVGDVRGITDPPIDLLSGLRAQVELQHRRHRGKMYLSEAVDPAVVVPPAVRSGLLNMLREALGNAVVHAPGSKIEIYFRVDRGDGILLVVADDGPGFDQERLPDMGRHGWFSLNTVALEIGAILSLTSVRGRGTTVSVQIPCQLLEEHHE